MMRKCILLFTIFAWVISCSRDSNNEFSKGSSDYNHTRSVGASANDLLSNSRYNSLLIEIQYMPGYAPDAQALDHVKNFLSAYLRKDNGITITQREIPGTSSSSLSADDIRKIENNNRTVFTNGSTMAINIMYYASETTDILGFITTGNIPQLDANCKADLKANGGK